MNYPDPRRVPAGTSDGEFLYVFGGCLKGSGDDAVTTNDLWRYDPGNDIWKVLSSHKEVGYDDNSTPGSRRYPSLNYHEDRLYLFGGCGERENFFLLNDLWMFDLVTEEWTKLKDHEFKYDSLNTPGVRYGHSSAVKDDSIIVFGGWYRHHETGETSCMNDLWRYDIKRNEWRSPEVDIETKPAPRYGAMSALEGSHFYVWGGWNPSGDRNDLWRFDTDYGTWDRVRSEGSLPEGRYSGSMETMDGSIFLISGRSRSTPMKRYSDVWTFNLSRGDWEKVETSAIESKGPSYIGKAAHARIGSEIIIFGGERLSRERPPGRFHSNSVWRYSPDNGEWQVSNPRDQDKSRNS